MFRCAVLLSLLCSQTLAQAPPDIAEIEGKVLANRRAIASGHVILDSTLREGGFSAEFNWTVYFMGKEIRQDMTRRYDVVPKGASGPDYTETTCFANGEYIDYSDRIMPDGGTMVLAIRDPKTMKESPFDLFDPRILGMAPLNCHLSSRMFRLDSFIGAPNRENVSLTREMKAGMDCVKITFKPPIFNVVRVWIAPAMGYNVVRMEQEFKGNGMEYTDSVELKIQKHDKSGLWFPISQHYQRVESGNRVTSEEHLKVTIVSLNEPIDSAVFTPAGMNVRPGTTVMYVPQKASGEHIWDGSRIVEPEDYAASGLRARRPWLVFAGLSALFVLLAVFFARQYCQRRAVS